MDERSRTLQLLRDARISAVLDSKRGVAAARSVSDGIMCDGGLRVVPSVVGGGVTNSSLSCGAYDVKGMHVPVGVVTAPVAASAFPVVALRTGGSGDGAGDHYRNDGDVRMMPLPASLADVLREDARLRNIAAATASTLLEREQEAKARRLRQRNELRGKQSVDAKSDVIGRGCAHGRLYAVD